MIPDKIEEERHEIIVHESGVAFHDTIEDSSAGWAHFQPSSVEAEMLAMRNLGRQARSVLAILEDFKTMCMKCKFIDASSGEYLKHTGKTCKSRHNGLCLKCFGAGHGSKDCTNRPVLQPGQGCFICYLPYNHGLLEIHSRAHSRVTLCPFIDSVYPVLFLMWRNVLIRPLIADFLQIPRDTGDAADKDFSKAIVKTHFSSSNMIRLLLFADEHSWL